MSTLYIIIIIAVLVLMLVGLYNGLVRARNRTQEAWADIEVQLKRRYDLIPNLVNTVKGYATHESGVFERVSEARERMLSAQGVKQEAEANNMLTESLKSIFAIAENYPDLKASQNFGSLQTELSDIEAKISYARQFYNNTVTAYNMVIVSFPSNLIASIFNFKSEEFFDAEEGIEKPVEVKF